MQAPFFCIFQYSQYSISSYLLFFLRRISAAVISDEKKTAFQLFKIPNHVAACTSSALFYLPLNLYKSMPLLTESDIRKKQADYSATFGSPFLMDPDCLSDKSMSQYSGRNDVCWFLFLVLSLYHFFKRKTVFFFFFYAFFRR
jgi:hypothetical protein